MTIGVTPDEYRIGTPRRCARARAAQWHRPRPTGLLDAMASPAVTPAAGAPVETSTVVRHFACDGSVFLGADYLIRGVAGRILWSLLQRHTTDGRTDFTNKEIRLDPSLELPTFRDNLDSRLILLKRRLDERDAPIRIERTGRGRLHLHVATPLRLVLEG